MDFFNVNINTAIRLSNNDKRNELVACVMEGVMF